MKTATHAYETLHSLHKGTQEKCVPCNELQAKEEAYIEAQVDQKIDDRYHGEHGKHV